MKLLMRIAAVALVALLVADVAAAQVRIQPYGGGAVKPNVPPSVLMIKPSQALQIAMSTAPAAKALGVQLRGSLYIVKLKQGSTVMQVRVNAANGAIQ